MKKDFSKKLTGLLLAGAMTLTGLMPAYAVPPLDNVPEGMDQGTYDRLYDDTVEWSELPDLIKYRNPTYTSYSAQIDSSMEDVESSLSSDMFSLKDQLGNVDDTLSELYKSQTEIKSSLPAGSPEREQALKLLDAAINEAKAGRKLLKDGMDELADVGAQLDGSLYVSGSQTNYVQSKESMERQLYPILEQLQATLEGLMISYGQLRVSRETLTEQVALYQRLYELQASMLGTGLGTAAELDKAAADLESAKADLSQVDSSMEQLSRAMGLQLGYSDSVPVIGEVPEPDLAYISSADPAADLERAAAENQTVKSAARSDGSTAGNESRDRNENAAKGQLSAKLSELYSDMKSKKLLYQSSLTTMEKAERTKASAERMYGLGMLSAAEYQAQILTYLGYKASAELAKLNLCQSINNYKWAVNGVVSLG